MPAMMLAKRVLATSPHSFSTPNTIVRITSEVSAEMTDTIVYLTTFRPCGVRLSRQSRTTVFFTAHRLLRRDPTPPSGLPTRGPTRDVTPRVPSLGRSHFATLARRGGRRSQLAKSCSPRGEFGRFDRKRRARGRRRNDR